MTSEPVDTVPGSDTPVILIAEDDEGHASLIERNLRRCGITQICHRFRDGQEVLDFLLKVSKSTSRTRLNPHILFLDGRMPKLSGQEVLRQIQSQRVLNVVPLTIVTTTDDSQERESFQALGCTYHLNKPVEINPLRQVLSQVQPNHQ
jgi:CheY-like chemotaxis protein